MKYVVLILFLIDHVSMAQHRNEDQGLPEPKRFIDRVEVFAGPGLSFNYGNKFVENYKDENVQNRRVLKVGYNIGMGLYHPLSDRIDINARVQYEQKGNKNELNVPLNPVNDDTRVVISSEYSYRYLTLSAMPQIKIGKNRQFMLAIGGYFSRIKQLRGYDRTHTLRDNSIEEGYFKARLFRDLRGDGAVYSFTWMPALTGIEKNDYGAILAAGYSVTINKKQCLTIQIIDNFGLININKDRPYDQEEKNHTVSLIIGYTFKRPPKK